MSGPTATLQLLLSIAASGSSSSVSDNETLALLQLANSPAQRGVSQVLNAGDNPIDPPQPPIGAATVCIVLFPASAPVIKFKEAASDAGYTLNTAVPLMLGVDTIVGSDGKIGSFLLNASAQCVVTLFWL